MATPLTIRSNNPGALRPITPDKWRGQTGIIKGAKGNFSVFSTPELGVRAFFVNARTQISRGNDTVEKFIYLYAPPNENLTETYVAKVAKALGGRNTPLSAKNKPQMLALANAIFAMEAGAGTGWEKKFTPKVISDGWDLYQGKEIKTVFNIGGAILLIAAALFLYYKFLK
jgi:hypothetical protein